MPEVTTQFYTKTSDSWDVMLADIKRAERSIDFEQYIFVVDSIGKHFLNLLIEKAKSGVKVRLLLDTVGSYTFYRSPLPEELKKIGIEIKFFNPISPWRIANFTSNFFRDHRKIMIIDETVGHIGSSCIQEHMHNWRDTHLRLTGPIVTDLKETFKTVWDQAHAFFRIRFRRIIHFVKKFDLLTNSPSLRQRYIYQAMINNIRNAQKYIYLTTPYFIPDTRLFRVLRLAAKRGVDVQIVMPEIADHILIDHARESYFTLLLKAGIKIYLYFPEMMHAKTAVIDDTWATAGSYNLDNLSAIFNLEANVASDETTFIQEIKQHFLRDIGHSKQIEYEQWIRRPLLKKLLELITWPIHGIL